MQAEVEDENGRHKLTPGELGSFFLLLVVAGNETTRNAISHGMLALTQHPDQRALWTADLEAVSPTAVEEIVRWATPVIHFRRTAVADTVVGGQEIKAGEKVVMFYNSANRDERAFDDPFRFDVTRTPERARRLRRRRPALLPRREPRPAGDPGHVRGAVPPPPRHRDQRRARHAPEQLHPRHQAHALHLAHGPRARQPASGRARPQIDKFRLIENRARANEPTDLDQRFDLIRALADCPDPGWIRTIRDALGMSSRQLAARMGLSQPAVSQLERSEVAGRIRLDSLRRAAAALECELVYALVPRVALEETLDTRARALARRDLASFGGTRNQDEDERDVEALAATLRDAGRLWDDRDAG